MGAKARKSLRGLGVTLLCVVSFSVIASAQEGEDSQPFIYSRVRRSPQWQYAKAGSSEGLRRDTSSGGNVRFLGLFNTDRDRDRYDRPYYNRPNYGSSGYGGSGSNFGLSLHYGSNNHYSRPNYGGGGGYYDPHYDYHGYDHHHHHHHPPPHRPYGPPPYHNHHYGGGGGGYGYPPPGYYPGRSAKASASASASSS